jgi:hypothetical protein
MHDTGLKIGVGHSRGCLRTGLLCISMNNQNNNQTNESIRMSSEVDTN